MTLLPLCHNIDEEGNRSRCWDTDKVRKDIVLDTQIFPWNIPVCPSPFKSDQKLVSVGGADYFSLKSNCIFSPPPSAIKETNVIATRRIWPFFISSSSSHSKNECPNFQGRNTKNGNCLWLENNSTSLEKNDKHDFLKRPWCVCCDLHRIHRSWGPLAGRSLCQTKHLTLTHERHNMNNKTTSSDIQWGKEWQGPVGWLCWLRECLRGGYAGTRTRIWN